MTYFIATIFNVCATLTWPNWVAAQGKHVLSEMITQKVYWLITVMCLVLLFATDSLDHSIAFQMRPFVFCTLLSHCSHNTVLSVLFEERLGMMDFP